MKNYCLKKWQKPAECMNYRSKTERNKASLHKKILLRQYREDYAKFQWRVYTSDADRVFYGFYENNSDDKSRCLEEENSKYYNSLQVLQSE